MLDEFKVVKHKPDVSEDHLSHATDHECGDEHSNYSYDDEYSENMKAFTDDIALTKALCESLINKKDLNVEGKHFVGLCHTPTHTQSALVLISRLSSLCRFGQQLSVDLYQRSKQGLYYGCNIFVQEAEQA